MSDHCGCKCYDEFSDQDVAVPHPATGTDCKYPALEAEVERLRGARKGRA